MTTYYKYKVRCITENTDKYWVLSENEPAPSACPTNTSHTVSSVVTIDDTISDNIVQIKEESIATGGNFGTTTLGFNIAHNSTRSEVLEWPCPITALAIEFISEEIHRGDIINMTVGEDTLIGAIGAPVSPASAWISQNYTAGQVVTYNTMVYTCILTTISNEVPTNTTYWTPGYGITVTSTVVNITMIGYYIKLDDLTQSDDVGRVLSINKNISKIYVEKNPTNTYSPLSPTYVRQTVKPIVNFEIGAPWLYTVGASKIGGSYVPSNVKITVHYENKSLTTDKRFVGALEYLY
jgi:hypothetical protein